MLTFPRRLWVNPSNGLYGLNYNVELARRFRQKGFSIYLDFHFRCALQLLRFEDTTKRALFVVDGVLVEHEALSKLKPDSIERVKVLKDSMATKKYGDRGRHGVIEIFMRGSRPTNKDTNTLTGIVDYAAPLSDHMNGKKLWEILFIFSHISHSAQFRRFFAVLKV